MRRSWLATCGVLLACGCGSSSGSGGGGQPDAGSDVREDRSTSDTGSDVAPSDTGADVADGSEGDSGEGDAHPPSLCPGSFIFCDGFEQNLTNWSQEQSSGGQVSVDSVHVYRGTKALHANLYAVADAGAQAYAYASKYGTQPWPAHVFTRFFAYVPSPSEPSIEGLLDLLHNGSPYTGLELRLVPPGAGLGMETYNTDAGQTWQSADASAALDQWVCLEMEVDTGAGTSHLYMNDVEVTDLAGSNLALMQLGITNVGLTLPSGNVQGASDAWIDEVAVDSARITCAR